jgi:hypothetical protein
VEFYIARRQPCGCCVGSAYATNSDIAATVAEWLRKGYTVHHVTQADWEAPAGCRCAPRPAPAVARAGGGGALELDFTDAPAERSAR